MNGSLPYAASRNFQITCMNYIDNKKEFLFFLKITVVKETMRKMKRNLQLFMKYLRGRSLITLRRTATL